MKKAGTILSLILLAGIVYGGWLWFFCRFYVGPDKMAIVTAKMVGTPLPPGQILAQPGQKGIQANVLGEGRHFLNPVVYDYVIRPVVVIKAGEVGIVTSKVGDELPEGEFLASTGEKGIWRGVLGPGKYRLNPYGYQIDIEPAMSIPVGYAGVITSLSGDQAPPGDFAVSNQKGVREDILQPGLYYVNPKQFNVDILEVGVNQVSLLGRLGGEVITKGKIATQNTAIDLLQDNVLDNQKKKRLDYLSQSVKSAARKIGRGNRTPAQQEQLDLKKVREEYLQGDSMATLGLAQFVEFPSRDGFEISLDMTVEFELLPSQIAGILSNYGDLPQVVDKIIMPQITSISRNKGSEYRAKDFIVGEGREKFQNDLTAALAKKLQSKQIIVHNALIRHVEVPMQILDPIQLASIAVEQDLTNKEKQNTAKKLAELNTEQTLIEQRREQVVQETEKIKAEIKADEKKQMAEIKAAAIRNVAQIEKESASIRADVVRKIETARAEAVKMVEGERANGHQLNTAAFGDPVAYSLWEFAIRFNPKASINIIHAGDGTLWTDLEKATLGDLGGATTVKQKKK